MKWATRALIHFDRVVSAWLIQRFVDREAQFIFLAEGDTAADEVNLFGLPGGRIAAHDSGVTAFQQILEIYAISDPALAELNRIVADVVTHVVEDRDHSSPAARDPRAAGVLAAAEGIMLLSATDEECLARSMLIYDGLYARIQAQLAIEGVAPAREATVLEQTMRLAHATALLRQQGASFSSDSFERALRARK
jgi:hypothetical protein